MAEAKAQTAAAEDNVDGGALYCSDMLRTLGGAPCSSTDPCGGGTNCWAGLGVDLRLAGSCELSKPREVDSRTKADPNWLCSRSAQ